MGLSTQQYAKGYVGAQSLGSLSVVYVWPVDIERLPSPLDHTPLIISNQAHTCTVLDLDNPRDLTRAGQVRWDGAVWSGAKHTVIIQTADCMPLVIIEARQRRMGVVHLSWRNLREGMLTVFLKAFLSKVGASQGNFFVGIGPRLCGQHLW